MENKIKEIAKQKNITLKDISKNLNISYRSLQRYSAGTREPDYKTIVDIANYLNVTVDEFLNVENKKLISISLKDFNELKAIQKRINEIFKKYE